MSISDVRGQKISKNRSLSFPIKLCSSFYTQTFIVCDICQDEILGQDFLLYNVRKITYQCLMLSTDKRKKFHAG